jgi:hypothetical protein
MGLTALEHVRTEQKAFTPPPGEFDVEIVPFGINHLDADFLMGVSPTMPQCYSIQGISGARKTTLMLNLVKNMCLSGTLPEGHKIVYDILESGQTIEKCLTILRGMLADQYMIYRHHTGYRDIMVDEHPVAYLRQLFARELPHSDPAALVQAITTTINGVAVPECVLKPSFIRRLYLNKIHMTPNQIKAWMLAGDALGYFPVEFFGVSSHYDRDERQRRSIVTDDIVAATVRWAELLDTCESMQIITDHLNAYRVGSTKDYDKQIIVTEYIDHFIKEHGVTVWILFQEGVTNRREYDAKGEVYGGKGGDAVKAISDTNWRVSYSKITSPYFMTLHSPVKSREGDHPDLALMVNPISGTIFGRSRIVER